MNEGFFQQLQTVEEIEARALAWKRFFTPAVLKFAVRLNTKVLSGFDWQLEKLLLESDCCEQVALKEIASACVHPLGEWESLEFKRERFYDKRGVLRLPLAYFVETSCIATVEIYVPKPIAVSVSSFKLEHQLTKYNDRWARLYCVDPRIGNGEKQIVAENRKFSKEAGTSVMFQELFSEASRRFDENLVTLSEDPLVDCVIRSNVKAHATSHRHSAVRS